MRYRVRFVCPQCGHLYERRRCETPPKFCTTACSLAYKRRGDVRTLRFWQKVSIRGKDECWPWQGNTNTWWGLYGYFTYYAAEYQQVYIPAHHYAYQLFLGEIPEGMDVRHTCETRFCCNPDHLYLDEQVKRQSRERGKGKTFQGGKLQQKLRRREPLVKAKM